MVRRLSIALVAAFSLLASIASAQTTTSFTGGSVNPTITVSNAGLTLAGGQRRYAIAFDASNKKVWIFHPYFWGWAGSTSGVGFADDPTSSATGAGTGSGTPAYFPSIGGFTNSGVIFTIYGAAANLIYPLPSGYSAWDTIAGGTLKWDSGHKNANITLSASDATATFNTSSGEASINGTTSITNGASSKAVYEFSWDGASGSLSGSSSQVGLGDSSTPTNLRPGSDGSFHAIGYWFQSPWYFGGSPWAGPGSILTQNTWERNAIASAGVSRSSGKRVFEFHVDTLNAQSTSNSDFTVGVAKSTLVVNVGAGTSYLGGTILGWGSTANNAHCHNNTCTSSPGSGNAASGDYIMIAVDLDHDKMWTYNSTSGKWNNDVIGNQNPATNTGGFSMADRSGAAVYPAASLSGFSGFGTVSAITFNFAGSFHNTAPSGFLAWDASPSGPRVRLRAASNDNFPPVRDAGDRCEIAA
jgi:hypothetical protein